MRLTTEAQRVREHAKEFNTETPSHNDIEQ